ncbi:hypothetical protein WG899_17980 [Paucibacter sp. AS339]|uniref:hypothetical protein n=1 Tax=Paucibacter hankyongi TaxID=3133434 RepID=UPI00309605BF
MWSALFGVTQKAVFQMAEHRAGFRTLQAKISALAAPLAVEAEVEVACRQQAQNEPKVFVKRLAPHIARWKVQGVNVHGNLEDARQYRLH